jgi:hypothetical protein
VSTVVEGSQDECVAAANGGLRLPVEGDGLAGPCANYDREDGVEAGVGGTHRIGMEAGLGRWWPADFALPR